MPSEIGYVRRDMHIRRKKRLIHDCVGDTIQKVVSYSIHLPSTTQQFNFAVSASPTSNHVALGGTATHTVTVTLLSDQTQPVTLSVGGRAPGTTASFSQNTGNPTFSSTLTIDASTDARTGTYTLEILATGGGVTHSTTMTLTVTIPLQWQYLLVSSPNCF